jgi:metallo-beta-lactamase class B
MTRSAIAVAVVCSVLAPIPTRAQATARERAMNQPAEPFRVVGILYVGASDIAVFLITTPEGHILINTGFVETVPLVEASVKALGFRMSDVKILLAGHAHNDHVGGHAALRGLTGAQVMVLEGDAGVIETGGKGDFRFEGEISWPPCPVDRRLKDGDVVRLGGTSLSARLTPGHTRGNTTWTTTIEEGGRRHAVVIAPSMTINPGVRLVNNPKYPEIARDYARSFALLRALPCEIFLSSHASFFDMSAKRTAQRQGTGASPFVDPQGYRAYLDDTYKAYVEQLAREGAAPPRL